MEDIGIIESKGEIMDNNIENMEDIESKCLCWWCSLNIKQQKSYSLPIRYENKSFETVGNFCCPECAAAYNFECGSKYGNKWSQYNLLNNLYKECYKEEFYHIKLAPPRELLKVFGGYLTYKQYEEIKHNKKANYNLVCPPIIPMNIQFEEEIIDKGDKPFVSIDNDKIKKANELILKRDKNRKNKNTLELFMGVKYHK